MRLGRKVILSTEYSSSIFLTKVNDPYICPIGNCFRNVNEW